MDFYRFIIKNKRTILLSLLITTIQFIVFKYFYPFADFFGDSYSYIYAASQNLNINTWPIGYSKFLSAFHVLTQSDTALVAFQYFFIELSALYLFFSLLYFFSISRTSRIVIFIFLFINPLFLYISNYINSDSLFAALSLLWITQLLWILYAPSLSKLAIHALLIFVCFTVRNNAYYYPFVSALGIILSTQLIWKKIVGISAYCILILSFIIYEKREAFKITGSEQFSLFTGWQLANNALYMYPHIQLEDTKIPEECKELDNLTKEFFKKLPELKENDQPININDVDGNFFIRYKGSPLKKYLWNHYKATDEFESIVAWGKVSPIYETYGKKLIKNHPLAFGQYFILPNIKNYLFPPLEKLEFYNQGKDEVLPIAQYWFNYKSTDVYASSKNIQAALLSIYPIIFLVANGYFIISFTWFLFSKRYKSSSPLFNRVLLLICVLLALNFLFSVSATMIVFRYHLFPLHMFFCISVLLMEQTEKVYKNNLISKNYQITPIKH